MRVDDDTRWESVRRAVRRMRDAADQGDHATFLQADLDFHSQLYVLADHPRLAAVWGQYLPTFTALLEVTINHDDDLHESGADHERLYDLLRGGEISVASAALEEHLGGAARRMREELVTRRE